MHIESTDQPRPPRVFVSHSSSDKDRFVRDFATKLYGKGYLRLDTDTRGDIRAIWIEARGLQEYASNFIDGYERTMQKVIAEIWNANVTNSRTIAQKLGIPNLLASHVARTLASRGLLRTRDLTGEQLMIWDPSPALKRLLDW